jgi:hypothetical protein
MSKNANYAFGAQSFIPLESSAAATGVATGVGAKQAAEEGLKTAQPEENHPSGPKGLAHFKRHMRHG